MPEPTERFPKADLGVVETPLEKMPELGQQLGINLWIKRDDCLPFTLGGNKVRQLEYYLGQALKLNADTVLITGAIQSNFVRLCAAACRKIGMQPIVQLEKRVPKDDELYNSSGNVLLNKLLGAEIHIFPEGENEAAADTNLDRLADDLVRQGKTPYVIHLGIDHAPIGALGYVDAASELYAQCKAQAVLPDHIIIPSGSGLTHAGFLCGARAIGWDVPVHGICVRRDASSQCERIARRSDEICQMIERPGIVGEDDIIISDAVLAPGYGQINAAVTSAIELAAGTEGLLLDPVYSGRAMAGLMERVGNGMIKQGETVVFIHTGGLASLFAYQKSLIN